MEAINGLGAPPLLTAPESKPDPLKDGSIFSAGSGPSPYLADSFRSAEAR